MSKHAGFAERYFGVNALKKPSTHDIPKTPLPTDLTLGPYKLSLDQSSGQWKLGAEAFASYQSTISTLNNKINELETNKSLNLPIIENETKIINLERSIIELQKENATLRFKNNVLINMCAIAEADYQRLSTENTQNINLSSSSNDMTSTMQATQPLQQRMPSQVASRRDSELGNNDVVMERTVQIPLRYQATA